VILKDLDRTIFAIVAKEIPMRYALTSVYGAVDSAYDSKARGEI